MGLLAFVSSGFLAVAEERTPIPQARPLSEAPGRFIEGVNVPPQKPSEDRRGNVHGERLISNDTTMSDPCNLPNADFENVPPVVGENGCGFQKGVRLNAVHKGDGTILSFSSPVLLSCDFAKRLVAWISEDVVPVGDETLGEPIEVIASGPGYQCRRRNNQPDGKLSEHALGTALDISGFQLKSGKTITVEQDWNQETEFGRFLGQVHRTACDRFTTVLGPDADPHHKRHLHVDIGCHGKDCTYLICQ